VYVCAWFEVVRNRGRGGFGVWECAGKSEQGMKTRQRRRTRSQSESPLAAAPRLAGERRGQTLVGWRLLRTRCAASVVGRFRVVCAVVCALLLHKPAVPVFRGRAALVCDQCRSLKWQLLLAVEEDVWKDASAG